MSNRKGNGDYVHVLKQMRPDELRMVYKKHIREDFPPGARRPLFGMERLQKKDDITAMAIIVMTP